MLVDGWEESVGGSDPMQRRMLMVRKGCLFTRLGIAMGDQLCGIEKGPGGLVDKDERDASFHQIFGPR